MSFPGIRTLIPHAGEMCLLERIVSASDSEIVCATFSHRSATNPLRRDGGLAALHLAEYGAQTMAVHGGLRSAGEAARGGMLVAIRDLTLNLARLDAVEGELTVHALKLVANASGRVYSFSATAGGRELGRGRVSVMFAGGAAEYPRGSRSTPGPLR
jgi:predicted hotdog family 3-hydroxylacyl-ACP dehydratase